MWINAGAAPVSPVLCAIVLGVAWRNTVGVGARWLPGLQWVACTLLKVGIALVGLRLTFSGIGAAAAFALPVVAGCILVALSTSVLLGRLLGLSQPLRLLVAAGTAVCGCTAIVALTPVTRAKPAETGIALSCVVVLGCLGMFFYPWLASSLFPGDVESAGVFLGTSIHDTSQVIGASLIYAQQFGADGAPAVAAFTKLLRNLSLLVLVPLFAMWCRDGGSQNAAGAGTVQRSQVLPAFLVWFVALAIVRTFADSLFQGGVPARIWEDTLAVALRASELLLVCGMTAVGLSVSLKDLKGVGSRVFLTALVVAAAVACSSLALIFVMRRLLPITGL